MARKLQAWRALLVPELGLMSGALLILISIANPAAALPVLVANEFHTASSTKAGASEPSPPPGREQIATEQHKDCADRPCIVLSFDDGPHQATTTQVLTILEQQDVTASFFLIGKN